MEIVYFVLGVVTVLLVIGVVIVVRVGTLVKELEGKIKDLETIGEYASNDIHRRIGDTERELLSQIENVLDFIGDAKDVLHKRIDDEIRMVQSNIDENEKDVLSLLDSRLDKLENKIKQKDLLKG